MNSFHLHKHLFYKCVLPIIILSGCVKMENSLFRTSTPTVAESSLCSTSYTYSSGYTVSGTASFKKRIPTVTTSAGSVTKLILGSVGSTAIPIKYAEVQIKNSSGSVVQCGSTDSNGYLKALDGTSALKVPNDGANYTVEVYSRAQKVFTIGGKSTSHTLLASVKEDIYSNTLYKVSTTISAPTSQTYTASLVAQADESLSSKIEGGAFNIYNDLVSVFEYLNSSTGTSDLSCLSSKLNIYWKAGFNPAQYIYPDADPSTLSTVSFYLRGENELYINGGVQGNVSSADTDHFDDAVIIHEIGHHIEDACGTMDSPGGSHYGQYRIDPRLAWSEGWGNFFGVHIIKNKLSSINPDIVSSLPNNEWLYYFDSEGYTGSGSTGYEYLRFNLTRAGNSTSETLHTSGGTGSVSFDPVDYTNYPGESHTREISISRGLFKGTNSCNPATCIGADNFSYYWQALEKASSGIGMGKSSYPFRSSIKFIDRLQAAKGGTLGASLTTMYTSDEALNPNGHSAYVSGTYTTWVPYGIKLEKSVTACDLKIIPRGTTYTYKSASDQRYSNHFYYLDLSNLPSVSSITLTATKNAGSTVDLDMIVFNEGYSFNEDCTSYGSSSCLTYAKTTSSDIATSIRTSGYTGKTISLAGLSSSSKYILDIRSYSSSAVANTTDYTYTLTDQLGGYLCPSTTF